MSASILAQRVCQACGVSAWHPEAAYCTSTTCELRAHPAPAVKALAEAMDEGFARVSIPGFDGLVHWRGTPGKAVTLHGPGRSLELLTGSPDFAIDLPGHGLSDAWQGAPPTDRAAWDDVVRAIAGDVSVTWEQAPARDPARLFPDLTPDRFGAYLTTAWSMVRAGHFFDPWYKATPAHAIDFDPAALDPDRLALEHRALLRATAARELAIALQSQGGR